MDRPSIVHETADVDEGWARLVTVLDLAFVRFVTRTSSIHFCQKSLCEALMRCHRYAIQVINVR